MGSFLVEFSTAGCGLPGFLSASLGGVKHRPTASHRIPESNRVKSAPLTCRSLLPVCERGVRVESQVVAKVVAFEELRIR